MSGFVTGVIDECIHVVQGDFYDVAKEVQKVMKAEAHEDTGALRSSIIIEKQDDKTYLIGVDPSILLSKSGRGFDYSIPYWKGHGAYTVRAKNRNYLKWTGKDGRTYYRKSVRIPPSKGDPFIERTVAKFQ